MTKTSVDGRLTKWFVSWLLLMLLITACTSVLEQPLGDQNVFSCRQDRDCVTIHEYYDGSPYGSLAEEKVGVPNMCLPRQVLNAHNAPALKEALCYPDLYNRESCSGPAGVVWDCRCQESMCQSYACTKHGCQWEGPQGEKPYKAWG